MTIRIVTDSTCDLPDEVVAEYGISVSPLYINIENESYLDGIDMTRAEFYRRLPDCDPAPRTSAPGPGYFVDLFKNLAEKGASQILSIHISERLSATINSARLAAEELSKFPVTVLDSGQLTLGMGFLVETAAKAAQAGESLGAILDQVKEQMARTYVFAALDTLEFLKRSGRMNRYVAGIGELIQLKPLLRMHAGDPAADKVRTRERALTKISNWLEDVAPLERLACVHTHVPERAAVLLERVRPLLPSGDVPSVDVTPVLGAHLGPGAVGFACVSSGSK